MEKVQEIIGLIFFYSPTSQFSHERREEKKAPMDIALQVKDVKKFEIPGFKNRETLLQ